MKKMFQLIGIACAMMGMSQSLFAATGNITFTNEYYDTLSIVLFEGDQKETDSIGDHDWAKGTFLGPRNQIIVIENGETKVIPVTYDTSKMITAVLYEGKKTGLMYTAGGSRLRGIGSYVKTMGRCTGAQCSTSIKQGQMCCERGGYVSYNNSDYTCKFRVEVGKAEPYVLDKSLKCGVRGPGVPDDDTPPVDDTTPESCDVPKAYTDYDGRDLTNSGDTVKIKNCTDNNLLQMILVHGTTHRSDTSGVVPGGTEYTKFKSNDFKQETKLVLFECRETSSGSNEYEAAVLKENVTVDPSVHTLWIVTKDDSSGVYSVTGVDQNGYDNCAPVVAPPPPPPGPTPTPTDCGVPAVYNDDAGYSKIAADTTSGEKRYFKNCVDEDNIFIMLVNTTDKKRTEAKLLKKNDAAEFHINDYNTMTHAVLFKCQEVNGVFTPTILTGIKSNDAVYELATISRVNLSDDYKTYKIITKDETGDPYPDAYRITAVESETRYNNCDLHSSEANCGIYHSYLGYTPRGTKDPPNETSSDAMLFKNCYTSKTIMMMFIDIKKKIRSKVYPIPPCGQIIVHRDDYDYFGDLNDGKNKNDTGVGGYIVAWECKEDANGIFENHKQYGEIKIQPDSSGKNGIKDEKNRRKVFYVKKGEAGGGWNLQGLEKQSNYDKCKSLSEINQDLRCSETCENNETYNKTTQKCQ